MLGFQGHFHFVDLKFLFLFHSKFWIMCFICSKLIFNTTTNFTKKCDIVLEISYYSKILWKKIFKSSFKFCEHLKRNYPLVCSNILHFIFLKHVISLVHVFNMHTKFSLYAHNFLFFPFLWSTCKYGRKFHIFQSFLGSI